MMVIWMTDSIYLIFLETESKDNDPDSSEPPKKRSKFLGNVDLNDPEVQKLLKSRSKHKGALAEVIFETEI